MFFSLVAQERQAHGAGCEASGAAVSTTQFQRMYQQAEGGRKGGDGAPCFMGRGEEGTGQAREE